jgi:aconitate hydratase
VSRARRSTAWHHAGLADLAPGRPVTCILRHADGTTETLAIVHSFSAPQLAWFRAGSA